MKPSKHQTYNKKEDAVIEWSKAIGLVGYKFEA